MNDVDEALRQSFEHLFGCETVSRSGLDVLD